MSIRGKVFQFAFDMHEASLFYHKNASVLINSCMCFEHVAREVCYSSVSETALGMNIHIIHSI